MMSRTQKTYADEFKKQIVELFKNGKTVKEIESEYDVSRTSIYEWNKMLSRTGSLRQKDNLSEKQIRIKELEKENKQLKMENDILKQAALIMGKR